MEAEHKVTHGKIPSVLTHNHKSVITTLVINLWCRESLFFRFFNKYESLRFSAALKTFLLFFVFWVKDNQTS